MELEAAQQELVSKGEIERLDAVVTGLQAELQKKDETHKALIYR